MSGTREYTAGDHLVKSVPTYFRLGRAVRLGCAASIAAAALCTSLPAAPKAAAATAARAVQSAPPPPFGSQLVGDIGSQTPIGTDFSPGCNTHANVSPVKVAGVQLPVGAALENNGGCGDGHLFLSVPGSGHFTGTITVDDAATLTNTSAPLARIFVLGHGGYILRSVDVPANKGKSQAIDVDVAGAEMVSVGMPNTAHSYLYAMHLTGSAHVRKPTPLAGSGAPSGAVLVNLSQVTFTCNAHIASPPVSISRITVPAPSAVWMTGCGMATVKVPSGSKGTFAMRVGVYDDATFTQTPQVVTARVLDASGLLLRKSVALAYQGGGLRPLWVNVTGGAQVTIKLDSGSSNIGLVGLSFLPGQYKQHANPDHSAFGSPSGAPVAVVPQSFAYSCNASAGTDDVLVNKVPVLRDSYIWANGCGIASLIMTDATGAFHAQVGVLDSTKAGTITKVAITVLDQNAHPLYTGSVTAKQGSRPVPVNVPITGGSILKLEFPDQAIVFNMTMTGHATLYDRVFPPSEPPVVIHGGVPINPLAFTVTCNVHVSTTDTLMIHAAALEQWTIDGNGCGSATLDLTTTKYPHHSFGARFGLAAADQHIKIAHVTAAVLNGKGKVVRSRILTAREGYGPEPFVISLSGGAKLQLTFGDGDVKMFAMTMA